MPGNRSFFALLCISIFLAACSTSIGSITGEGLPELRIKGVSDPGSSTQWTLDWQLGEPDLIVKLSAPYSLPLEESDVFRSFVIPNVTASDRYVRALEFKLDNPGVVHHAEFKLDETDASWRLENKAPGSGYGGMENKTARYPDGHFLNWVPGKRASELPENLAWRLPAQADLVVQLHMMPSGFEEVIDPQIGLYFADQPPGPSPEMLWLGSRWLPIEAGDSDFTTRDSYELPSDVEVMSVLPHCHFICSSIRAWASLPDGSERRLVTIEEWNFYRQEEFHFERPLILPRGTIVTVEFSYDNSADNLRNPNNPPLDIEFGPLSSNEMADLWIQVISRSDIESMALRRSTARHLQKKIIEQQINLFELEPDFTGLLQLAADYRRIGRLPEALAKLQQALRLAPENATVLESLAITLTDMGRNNEALVYWQGYVQLVPNDSLAHLNLGTALGSSNQVKEALYHLRRATELDPSFGPTFYRLGRAQSYLGQFDDALVSFRAAMALDPDEPIVLQSVARLLATHPDSNKRRSREALELANRALQFLPGHDAMSLSTLAAAQAATGDFKLAATTARLALSRIAPGEERAADSIIKRQLDYYQQGQIEVARAAGEKRFVAPGHRLQSAKRVE